MTIDGVSPTTIPQSRSRASLLFLTIWTSLIFAIPTAHGQEVSKQQAVQMIIDAANQICLTVPLEQNREGWTLSGDAQAKVGGVVGKIANLGVAGAAEYQTERSSGVLQKDLVNAIQSGNDCRRDVLHTLWRDLLGDYGSSPASSMSHQPTPDPQRAPKGETSQALSDLPRPRQQRYRNDLKWSPIACHPVSQNFTSTLCADIVSDADSLAGCFHLSAGDQLEIDVDGTARASAYNVAERRFDADFRVILRRANRIQDKGTFPIHGMSSVPEMRKFFMDRALTLCE